MKSNYQNLVLANRTADKHKAEDMTQRKFNMEQPTFDGLLAHWLRHGTFHHHLN